MKQVAYLLVTFSLVLGILLIAVADINNGDGLEATSKTTVSATEE